MGLVHYASTADDAVILVVTAMLALVALVPLAFAVQPGARQIGERVSAVAAAGLLCAAYTHFARSVCFSHPSLPIWPAAGDGSGRIAPFVEELHAPLGQGQLEAEFAAFGRPAVVRGLAADEVASGEWDPAYLSAMYGHRFVDVHSGNVEQGRTDILRFPFSDFLSLIEDAEEVEAFAAGDARQIPYMAEEEGLVGEAAALRMAAWRLYADLGLASPLLDPQWSFQAVLWIGPAGARTGLHSDVDPMSVLFQANGTKTVWLVPPEEAHVVPVSAKYDPGAVVSSLDPFAAGQDPDAPSSPHGLPHPLRVDLGPGDALFVPPGWFHYARATSPSISVAIRALSLCQSVALGAHVTANLLHDYGLYRTGACTCHQSWDPG